MVHQLQILKKVMDRLIFSKYHVTPTSYEGDFKSYSSVPKTVKRFEIWSKENSDVCKNLKKILGRTSMKEDIISELLEFNKRIHPVNVYMPEVCKKLGLRWYSISEYTPSKYNNREDMLKHEVDYIRKKVRIARIFEIMCRDDFVEGEEKELDIEKILKGCPETPWQMAHFITSHFSKKELPVEVKQSCLSHVGMNPIMAGDGSTEALDDETFCLLFYHRPFDWDADHDLLYGKPKPEF